MPPQLNLTLDQARAIAEEIRVERGDGPVTTRGEMLAEFLLDAVVIVPNEVDDWAGRGPWIDERG